MRNFLFAAAVLMAATNCALAQAAAEAVITHGAASAVANAMSTSVGQAARHLGDKIGQAIAPSVVHPQFSRRTRSANQAKLPSAAAPPRPNQGFVIASIQGAGREESTCGERSGARGGPSSAVKVNALPSQTPPAPNCAVQDLDASGHPAVINLAPEK